MRHGHGLRKLNRTSEHRLAMLRNMMNSLIEHEVIKTTLPKAKQTRRDAEKIVTLARKGTLSARRLAASRLNSPEAVQKLFDAVAPVMVDRPGGYTRIVKIGPRRGDNAEMALIEWVTLPAATAAAAPAAAQA